ncbi:hypothetical protein L6452_05683 [Arctium lappa]|uniref:Uncharacterized protein n=1 Tax=Arctium lappa TaxID=4217 RepID=A0ACB9EHR7_ARCLA|nr:hypothetical protein L6452_05683 [Arctium lappa]
MLLDCICKKVGDLEEYEEILDHCCLAFNLAVENDIPEAIDVIIRYIPQATWIKSSKDYNLSQNAIMNRSENVYKFLVEKVANNHILRTCTYKEDDSTIGRPGYPFQKKKKKEDHSTLLHLVGKLAPIHKLNVVPGAALQMQREFQWFKEVEKFVFPSYKEKLNHKQETPMTVFIKTHEELRKDGEEWMKKTADSYTITAALIITIAFAAAITVPGGNSGDTGKAIFERQASFIVFVVSDAISLFTSSNSLLLFLSVLTARYREEDFLKTLPTRLILGLVMLFMSMTSMIVAFSATLYLLFGQENTWILIPIAVLTCLPIASFITLQFPLLTELIRSTYGRGIFPKHPRRE